MWYRGLRAHRSRPYPEARRSRPCPLTHDAQQLLLQNELALLVFLTALVCLVVLPPYRLLALPAVDVAHNVSSGGHVTFDRIGLCGVHNVIEEVGFAMLAAEILE